MVRCRAMSATELKDWREKRGLSQPRLAEILGVHAMTVSKWEREVQAIPPFLPLALETIERRQKLARKKKVK